MSDVPIFSPRELRFYRRAFYAAAAYNLVWGALVILFPVAPFGWAGMARPNYPQVWQCVGMFVIVFALGYWYVARDPVRYAPFALIGLLGKTFGPVGWVWGYLGGQHPAVSGVVIVFNDLLWWPLFIPFVWRAWRRGLVRPASAPCAPPRGARARAGG